MILIYKNDDLKLVYKKESELKEVLEIQDKNEI